MQMPKDKKKTNDGKKTAFSRLFADLE